MGDVIPLRRMVVCSVCGAEAPAKIPNPSKSRVMIDAAPGAPHAKAVAETIDLLTNLPGPHNGPCGRPCCNAEHGEDFHPTSARGFSSGARCASRT